jgi:PAS domain S-box-containing protein
MGVPPDAAAGPVPGRLPGRELAVRAAAFVVVHFALCRLGDVLTVASSENSTFWPASGLALAVLLLSPRATWPWYLAGVAASGMLSGALAGRNHWLTLAFTSGDVIEAALGAWLVRRVAGRPAGRLTLRFALTLVLAGAVLAALANATVAMSAVAAAYGERGPKLLLSFVQYWSGDALGVLLLTPALLAWASPGAPRAPRSVRRVAESALLSAASAAAAALVFGLGEGLHLERSFLLLPVLVWAAFRFGLRGAATVGVGTAVLSAWSTAVALAGSVGTAAPQAAFQVQLILAVSITAAFLLATTLEDREAAVSALRESEARLGGFMEHSPASLYLLDAEGRLVDMSRSYERMAAQPAGALAGTTARERLPGVDGDQAHAEDLHVLATGQSVRVDRVIAGRIYMMVKFRIPRGDQPPLLGGVGVDVTDQRLAERSLRLAQVALDRNFTALLFLDPSGCVTYANEAAGRLFGRAAPALLGRSAWELDGAVAEASWPAAWRRLREQGSLVLDGRLLRPTGRRLEAEVGLVFVAYDGQEYAVYAARDLSERRRAEGAQRLASVGTLAAGMAHEINNPLTFVAANLAYALDRLGALRGDSRADEAARALEDAEEGTRRVARVVRHLKTVSRVEATERRPVDVRAEIETALKLAQNELRHRARLTLRLDEVPAVEAAEFQLGQVFLNLLVNAAHAIPEGDAERHRVTVVSRTSPQGWAVVEVGDTGCGIPAAVRARIFEPFFTTKPVGQGTGLGLSVCHGIVSGLGGRIEVESEEGQGTVFRVALPPAAAAREAPAHTPAPRPEAPRARILVVDDEPLVGSTIRRVLSGHEVVALTDPREALGRLLGDGPTFDLVLCDLMMPQLTGMDLHAAVAEKRPVLGRRIVFMTGGAFTDRARQFLEQSPNPQLQKPFQPQELRDQVRTWLAERR